MLTRPLQLLGSYQRFERQTCWFARRPSYVGYRLECWYFYILCWLPRWSTSWKPVACQSQPQLVLAYHDALLERCYDLHACYD